MKCFLFLEWVIKKYTVKNKQARIFKKWDFSKRISNHHDLPSGVEFFKEEIDDCGVASDAQSFEYRASDLVNVTQYNRGEKDFR